MTTKTKPARGGARPGAGRKPRGSEAGRKLTVALSPEEQSTLLAAIRTDPDGKPIETLTDMLREGGLELARRRLGRP